MPSFANHREDPEAFCRPSAPQLAILNCDRCGFVQEMTADSYHAGWPTGMRCGVCGPPYLLMSARFTQSTR